MTENCKKLRENMQKTENKLKKLKKKRELMYYLLGVNLIKQYKF